MSVETGLIIGSFAVVYMFLKMSFKLGKNDDGAERHTGLKLLYFGTAQFFSVIALGITGKIADANGYPTVAKGIWGVGGIVTVLVVFFMVYVYITVWKRGTKMAVDGELRA